MAPSVSLRSVVGCRPVRAQRVASRCSIPIVAEQRAAAGEAVVLVREETTPDDFHGIVAARAVVTARGGMTSHAAVVARGMGKCAVVGCRDLTVDLQHRRLRVNDSAVPEGEWLTVDGATGAVYRGELPTVPSEVMRVIAGTTAPTDAPLYQAYAQVLEWADEVRTLTVRANADTPRDARIARGFGAEGIGLCRTEHMFFEGDRIAAMREMIVARDEGGRRRALAKLLPMQRDDFEGLFAAMDGYPVTIRLLDPPLHEFLPHGGEETKLLARTLGLSRDELSRVVDGLREVNPMLGHRGCRLGITYPEITEMQARAIFEAAVRAARRGVDVRPEIMIPFVATAREFDDQRALLDRAAEQVMGAMGEAVPYLVGTMIELPRAALTADEIAVGAEFFSFGTNDLTQTTLGLSRDDAGRFLPSYIERGIFPDDPFQVLDQAGVGKLIQMAVKAGRSVRPTLKVGICGEHGGEPRSVAFCHRIGLDYVSCSPYRVPVARLAAAQAALDSDRSDRLGRTRSDEPIQHLVPSYHPELLARDSLLGRWIAHERAGQGRERVDVVLQTIDLDHEIVSPDVLAIQVQRAVLATLNREQGDRDTDRDFQVPDYDPVHSP